MNLEVSISLHKKTGGKKVEKKACGFFQIQFNAMLCAKINAVLGHVYFKWQNSMVGEDGINDFKFNGWGHVFYQIYA